jgi:hypothetical protein
MIYGLIYTYRYIIYLLLSIKLSIYHHHQVGMSTCVMSIRRQQSLGSLSRSSASFTELPARIKFKYASHLLPMTFPHVKHRTGMIIAS